LEALIGDRSVLMKIDVEGAEVRVARGMKRFLQNRKIEKVVVEVSSSQLAGFGATPRDLYREFKSAGFAETVGLEARPHYNEVFVRK
jgi:hypothetical protein